MSGLRVIARELNIGTDALAFFDDNPMEREWVSSQMPEVTVISLPTSEPLGYVRALEESGAFDHLTISEDDRKRADYYQREVARKRSQAQSSSIEAFLKELQMTATVGFIDGRTRSRVTQLLAKTNQFNLTTRRHSEADLDALTERGAVALWLRLEDRYGGYGLVGVAIAVPAKDRWWTIDSFLLSCRVLGRQVETTLVAVLAQTVSDRGGVGLIAELIPTSKNSPTKDFPQNHGFEAVDDDGRMWRRSLSCKSLEVPEFMKVKIEDE